MCFCLCFAALLWHFERSAGVVRAGRGGGGVAVVFFWFFAILYMVLWDQTSDVVALAGDTAIGGGVALLVAAWPGYWGRWLRARRLWPLGLRVVARWPGAWLTVRGGPVGRGLGGLLA